MKKNLVLPAVVGTLLAAMVLGCASAPKPLVWDETLSDEESATVYFTDRYSVTTYNDLSLGKAIDKDGKAPYTRVMKIPAGKTTFTGVADISIYYNYNTYAHGYVSDVPVTYDFEAGKIYCVAFGSSTFKEYEEAGHNMYFSIYDGVTVVLGTVWAPTPYGLGATLYLPAGDGTYITKLKDYDVNKKPEYLLAKIPVNIEVNLPKAWKL